MSQSAGWGAGAPLRPYQRRAVDLLLPQLRAPGSRACLIAPPGAGKTRCGLHIAAALDLPIEVRVPTRALVSQWEARAKSVLVTLDDDADRPTVSVHTYAANAPLTPGALVILDEAHHLGGAWGRQVRARVDGTHRVLGLTGTPSDSDAPNWIALMGSAPVRIDAPPLVRDGHLSPYRELVWPTLAGDAELTDLSDAAKLLDAAERADADALRLWVGRRLREDLWALTEDRFAHDGGLLVALCRVRHADGLGMPNDLPPDPELRAAPGLYDRALVLWDWDGPGARDAVRAAGFRGSEGGRREREGGLRVLDDRAWRALAAAPCRLAGAIDVLALEHAHRADDLRAVLLTERDGDNTSRLGARAVLRALVGDRRTDPLDPILVTGSVFWVDDDMWPRLVDRLPPLPWQRVGDHHELDVRGWSVADRVGLATRLLTEGLTRCLVGTRHLLGEGWDCPAVNCLIDLTGVVAETTVLQLRGRALRLDPADPSKVASLWDVVALTPTLPGGDRMLRDLEARHANTLGVAPDGRVVCGLDRVSPDLRGSAAAVAAVLPQLQETMRARAQDTIGTAALWAVGQGYADERVFTARGVRATPPLRPRVPIPPPVPLPTPTATSIDGQRRGGLALLAGGTAAGAALAAITGVLLFPVVGPLVIPISAGLLFAGGVTGLWGMVARRQRGDRSHAIVRALHTALTHIDPDLGDLHLHDGDAWADGSPAARARFANGLATLFGPVRYPRYLLLEPSGRAWPVPTALGAQRTLADSFADAWCAQVGPAAAIYARGDAGRVLLQAAWSAGDGAVVRVEEGWR